MLHRVLKAGVCCFTGPQTTPGVPCGTPRGLGHYEPLAIEDRLQISIALFIHGFVGDKTNGGAIYAIAFTASIARTVIKDVAQMTITHTGTHFGANHPVTLIHVIGHHLRIDRLNKARPPTAGLVLIARDKKRLTRRHIHIDPLGVIVHVLVTKGAFGIGMLRDVVL